MNNYLVENVARQLFEANREKNWFKQPPFIVDHYKEMARIAIAATMRFYKVTS
jgi:hypothetical protein